MDNTSIFCSGERATELSKVVVGNLLFSFVLGGVTFFFKGEVSFLSDVNLFKIELDFNNFYRCERRENFRLQTFSLINVQLGISKEYIQQESNVLHLRNKNDENVKLFKAYLDAVGKVQEKKNQDVIFFDVFDISLGGLSIIINSSLWSQQLMDRTFSNCNLIYKNENIIIPEISSIRFENFNEGFYDGTSHREDEIDSQKFNGKVRVAFQYNNLPETIEIHLGKLIGNEVREDKIEALFESMV